MSVVPDDVWNRAHYISNQKVPVTCFGAVDARVVLDKPNFLFIEVLYATHKLNKHVAVAFLDESGYQEAVTRDPQVEDFIATRFEKEFEPKPDPLDGEEMNSMMKRVYSSLQIPEDMLNGRRQ